jgi:hypothetical protein
MVVQIANDKILNYETVTSGSRLPYIIVLYNGTVYIHVVQHYISH